MKRGTLLLVVAMLMIPMGPPADSLAGDARFFGSYCGSFEETQWVPGFLFIPFPITYRFAVQAQIEYRENSRGHGVLAGRGRVEGEGRRVPFVFTGLVTQRGEARGSVVAPGVDPVSGRAHLSADDNHLKLEGLGRTVNIYKDRCGNEAPTAAIVRPEHGHAPFGMDEIITFRASIDDPDDTLPFPDERMVWRSSRDGLLGRGNPVFKDNLTPGLHNVVFTATDSGGRTAVDAVTLIVQNDPPNTPVIRRPRPDETFCVGQAISFEGEALDPEEGLMGGDALVWHSNLDGRLRDTGMHITQSLSAGRHHITLTATDGGGLSRSETVSPINIVSSPSGNTAPSVSIQRPDSATFPPLPYMAMGNSDADCYRLEAVANDCQDDADALSYEWRDTSSCTPPEEELLGTAKSINFCGLCAPDGGADVNHDITVTVTDRGGLTATAIFNVYVIPGGLY